MKACIFLGPTLPHHDALRVLDGHYLPPAAKGDIYRAACNRPKAIGLIDGCFHQVPAVWHKEMLWAMSRGIHLFGSASMGALRAAELQPFGMAGVGQIFASFRDGRLEDDDEVAVWHGPAESGYLPLSEALVNIRATLGRAAAERVIDEPTRTALTGVAKAIFYADRSFPEVLKRAAEAGLPERTVDRLRKWLPGGRVDQKRRDATAMLQVMHDRLSGDLAPLEVGYRFQRTEIWERAFGKLADLSG